MYLKTDFDRMVENLPDRDRAILERTIHAIHEYGHQDAIKEWCEKAVTEQLKLKPRRRTTDFPFRLSQMLILLDRLADKGMNCD